MKQLLSLFLFLLPCLAWAQYPSNGNQKITLGEQTTADGLIWRGVASIDTVTATSKITRSNKQDTSAFLLLDTTTNLLWHYKTASNGWLQAGGSTLDTATMLLPYYRSGRTGIIQSSDVPTLNQNTTGSAATLTTSRTFQTNLASTSTASFNGSANVTPGVTGTLPVANGGTGGTSYLTGAIPYSNGTILTSDTSKIFFDNTNKRLGIGLSNPSNNLHVKGTTRLEANDEMVNFYSTNATKLSMGYYLNGSQHFYVTTRAGILGSGTDKSMGFYPMTNDRLDFGYSTTNAIGMSIISSGRVGIRTTAPDEVLHVVGNAKITAMGGIGDIGADANGVLQAATSDMNLKNTIENSPFGLNEILLLNPVTFLYNDTDRKIDSDVKEVGFIAQDVFDIIPNAVSSTGTGDLQLDYRAITATLTKAIQEQNSLIKALEQRIINLENK